MPSGASAKGNPASHRMSNPALKARRAASWARGQARKLRRQQKSEAAHKRNQEQGWTPWQRAQEVRAARRHPEGNRRALQK